MGFLLACRYASRVGYRWTGPRRWNRLGREFLEPSPEAGKVAVCLILRSVVASRLCYRRADKVSSKRVVSPGLEPWVGMCPWVRLLQDQRATSSVGERCLDKAEVAGSNPAWPMEVNQKPYESPEG